MINACARFPVVPSAASLVAVLLAVSGCTSSFDHLVRTGNADAVESRLQEGAQGVDLDRGLRDAAARGHLDVAALLIEHGADVNATTDDGESTEFPLLVAASNGHLEIVTLLVSQGAQIDKQSNVIQVVPGSKQVRDDGLLSFRIEDVPRGATALLAAVDEGHGEVARVLLRHGADPKIVCVYEEVMRGMGEWRSSYRSGGVHIDRSIIFEGGPVVRFVVRPDGSVRANFDPGDETRLTPLLLAVIRNRTDLVELMRDSEATR